MTGVDGIPDEFLLCRDLSSHAWEPWDVRMYRKVGEIHRLLRCTRCKTIRNQILTRDGYLTGRNSYTYPENYLMKGRLTAADRAKIRMMSTQQMTPRVDRRRHA